MRSVFIDTNVLIYARSHDFPMKAAQARTWLSALTQANEAVISPQVVNEFVAASQRRYRSLPLEEIFERASALLPMCHAPLDAATTINAMSIQSQYGTSWWDALIVASAVRAGCRYIVSEDMQAGMRFGAVTIVNPFESSPDEVLRTH